MPHLRKAAHASRPSTGHGRSRWGPPHPQNPVYLHLHPHLHPQNLPFYFCSFFLLFLSGAFRALFLSHLHQNLVAKSALPEVSRWPAGCQAADQMDASWAPRTSACGACRLASQNSMLQGGMGGVKGV